MSSIKSYFKDQFKWQMLSLEHSNAADFYLSCWQSTRSAIPLLVWRVLLFLSALGIVLASMVTYMLSGLFGFWFIYLTHWGLTFILLSTGFAAAVSIRCYFYGPITAGAEFTLPWFVKTYWALYNVAVPLAFLITIFYWTMLYEAGFAEEVNHGLDVAIHGANSILMFLLLASSSHPSRLLHVYQPLALALVYVFFSIIYYLAGGVDMFGNRYIYPVVDWSNPGVTIGLVALTGVLLLLVHIVTTSLTAGRDAMAACVKPETVQVAEAVPLRQQATSVA